jgi:hypothetical protein
MLEERCIVKNFVQIEVYFLKIPQSIFDSHHVLKIKATYRTKC